MAGLFEQEVDVDISNLTKTVSVALQVTKTTADSFGSQTPATVGNSLPDAGKARVRAEDPSSTSPVSPPSSEELDNIVAQANVTLQGRSSDLKFTVAEGTDISVVRIEDSKTGELIRQVPSEAMVAIARALDQAQRDRGMVFEEKA